MIKFWYSIQKNDVHKNDVHKNDVHNNDVHKNNDVHTAGASCPAPKQQEGISTFWCIHKISPWASNRGGRH